MKNWKIVKFIITVSLAVLIVSLLVAFLSVAMPESNQNNISYEGTELSYFAADKWISDDAQKDFNDIAYFFDDVDWNKYFGQVLRVVMNPGEAAKTVKEELHIDPAELFIGQNSSEE